MAQEVKNAAATAPKNPVGWWCVIRPLSTATATNNLLSEGSGKRRPMHIARMAAPQPDNQKEKVEK